MVLSKTVKRQAKDTYISLYMPLFRGHLTVETQSRFDDIKQAVLKMGGKSNAGCRFLKTGCKDTHCTSENTAPCKGVLQIPRSHNLSKKLLRMLDSGKLLTFMVLLHVQSCINNMQCAIHMKKNQVMDKHNPWI